MHNTHQLSSSRSTNALAVVPARLLPYKQQWQILANALPPGSIFVCLPNADDAHHQLAWDAIVRSIRATGHPLLVLSMEHFLEGMRRG